MSLKKTMDFCICNFMLFSLLFLKDKFGNELLSSLNQIKHRKPVIKLETTRPVSHLVKYEKWILAFVTLCYFL